VRNGSPAAQAWPVAQAQAGVVMAGEGVQLTGRGVTIPSALRRYNRNVVYCQSCSYCQMLPLVHLALLYLGVEKAVAPS
jgi:hypothetical protein